MKLLQEICSIPTAPFVEDRVMSYVDAFVRTRPRLKIQRDRFGNRLITLAGKSKSRRIVFVAHTDHPGFVARRMINKNTLEADFRGGVLREYLDGARVRFFDGNYEITGTVIRTRASKERAAYPDRATIRVSQSVPSNTPGMFDQGIGRAKGNKFHSRVCDDLAGVASALTMLDELLKSPAKPQAAVCVLLTRAEEDGFIGAIAAVLATAHDGKLLRKTDLMISIECSAEQPYAQQGNGVIIRVGDRISVFNSAFTFFIIQQAELLAKRDKKFKHQRSLMPGGACEGTVLDAYGYTTSAVCVPLANYHNMDRAKKKIGPEFIDLNDWNSMVQLFVSIAKNAHDFDPLMTPLKDRLTKRFDGRKDLLTPGRTRHATTDGTG